MIAAPKWLDPKAELPLPPGPVASDDVAFVRAVTSQLESLNVPTWQRFELAGIAAHETGWGSSRACVLGNMCGNKAKREIVEEYRRRTGKPQHWFRAPGHKASGDADEVIYLAWPGAPALFWSMWLWRHVGEFSGERPAKARYATAAERFWDGDPAWIAALIDAQYRGAVTAGDPKRRAAAIANHASIVQRCRRLAT